CWHKPDLNRCPLPCRLLEESGRTDFMSTRPSRVNRLERAEQRRLTLEIKASGHHATKTEPSPSLTPPSPERVHCALSTSLSDTIAQCLKLEHEIHDTASKLCILGFEPLK